MRRAADGRSFDDFARRYVDGREPYPWPTMLRTIGLMLERDSVPRLGVTTTGDAGGIVRVTEVTPGGAAAVAGVRAGDLLERVGDVDVRDPNFGVKFRAALRHPQHRRRAADGRAARRRPDLARRARWSSPPARRA